MADATEDYVVLLDAEERNNFLKVLDEVELLRKENARLFHALSSTIAERQTVSSLLGMAEGVLAKADEVVTAHHANACTPALVARLECGILRFRTVKAKDLPPAGLVS